ncbi:uncharacterized protein LOC108203403 [Daucus carota subsp. sativus]|uniref:uncharacterized protein LOC108203403 n=1 Tax=Daucus carota subsp. sativus TaxID=79200 RepID=UPI0007EFCD71|nr:PREDICTED: uncharacterized protein LOC108203403 [Daucus carota subsp. sativus]
MILGQLLAAMFFIKSAFVPGRKIGDSIMLAQALFRNYHLNSGPSRCAFKIDLRKAFDSISWSFISSVLSLMGFPPVFKDLIMTCIFGSMLSVKINGAIEGFFAAGSGLRQGDPLSPYLFVLCMEILRSCLEKHTSLPDFKHHWLSKDLKITHISFADDILMFCHGDSVSVDRLLAGLNEFSHCSGMRINSAKSQFFISNVDDGLKHHIRVSTGFSEGSLPAKYLGLPLISTKLSMRCCLPLIVRVQNRIDSWLNTCLNQAGRLQLIKAVLFGLQGYWSAHLLLPKSVLKKLQSLFVKFLWGGSSDNHKVVKVKWSDCCFPKIEGGLGLYDLCQWNNAVFLFHLWRITQPDNNSLWIMWFKRTYLKRRAFWTMDFPKNAPWCIRKILQLRPLALRFINYHVGASSNFLLWHDPWVNNKPLLSYCHPDVISSSNSRLFDKVASFMSNSSWLLPSSNHLDVIQLRSLIGSIPIHSRDSITWMNSASIKISSIWQCIRSISTTPPWIIGVWHQFAIPKCAFTLWLAFKERLLTKDRMIKFNMNTDLACIFCNRAIETHSHLFGSFEFMTDILNASAFNFTGVWQSYLNGQFFLGPIRGIRKYIGLLYLAIFVYLLWQERNLRRHDPGHNSSAASIIFKVKLMMKEKLHSNKKFKLALKKNPSLVLDLY